MNGQPWTPRDEALLRDLYPDHTTLAVAALLGRSVSKVYAKACRLGLSKSADFLAGPYSGRMRLGQNPNSVPTRFKAGQVSWNKGRKGVTGTHPNTRSTQFKKGEMNGAAQHNYVAIGSVRINGDGHLERKTTDDPSLYPARRWTPVYRLVWEAQMGPIPRGHVVVFKPSCKTVVEAEITVDRLECISRAELGRRNNVWRRNSPEMASLIGIKGAITRQVNRINREARERQEP